MRDFHLDKIEDSDVREAVAEYVDSVDEFGTIRSPGKFEGEPLHTVYFYQWVLIGGEGDDVYEDCEHDVSADDYMGCDCEVDLAYSRLTISASDAEVFPELAEFVGGSVKVGTTSVGFTWSALERPGA